MPETSTTTMVVGCFVNTALLPPPDSSNCLLELLWGKPKALIHGLTKLFPHSFFINHCLSFTLLGLAVSCNWRPSPIFTIWFSDYSHTKNELPCSHNSLGQAQQWRCRTWFTQHQYLQSTLNNLIEALPEVGIEDVVEWCLCQLIIHLDAPGMPSIFPNHQIQQLTVQHLSLTACPRHIAVDLMIWLQNQSSTAVSWCVPECTLQHSTQWIQQGWHTGTDDSQDLRFPLRCRQATPHPLVKTSTYRQQTGRIQVYPPLLAHLGQFHNQTESVNVLLGRSRTRV